MSNNVTMTAVDGRDALAFVIIRPGATDGGVAIEAAANGMSKPAAAYVLRHVAEQFDAATPSGQTGVEVDLRAALNDLATRYEATASRATTDVGKSRARQISQAAADIRHVLTTGRMPAYLVTDSKPEVTS